MRSILAGSALLLVGVVFVLFLGPKVIAADKSDKAYSNGPLKEDVSFSFIVWGHPRGKSDQAEPLHFKEVLDRVAELEADLLIVTGDVIMGGPSEPSAEGIEGVRAAWDRFDAGVSRLGIPVYRVPGNHDVHSFATRDLYLERYTKPPFAFSFRGSRFILLETVGIDQRGQGDGTSQWGPNPLPFDDAQLGLAIEVDERIPAKDEVEGTLDLVELAVQVQLAKANDRAEIIRGLHPSLLGSRTLPHEALEERGGDFVGPFHGPYPRPRLGQSFGGQVDGVDRNPPAGLRGKVFQQDHR